MQKQLIGDLPEWINKEDWDDWVDMRRKRKAPLTTQGQKRAIKTLERLRQQGYDPNLCLNQSVDRGWTGLFPLSESYMSEQGMLTEQEAKVQATVIRMSDRRWAE